MANYDSWKTTPPDTDECTDDHRTCECPTCREWRENYEGPETSFEDAMEKKHKVLVDHIKRGVGCYGVSPLVKEAS